MLFLSQIPASGNRFIPASIGRETAEADRHLKVLFKVAPPSFTSANTQPCPSYKSFPKPLAGTIAGDLSLYRIVMLLGILTSHTMPHLPLVCEYSQ